jgi:tetratricopeptide (TPR) repeat protein
MIVVVSNAGQAKSYNKQQDSYLAKRRSSRNSGRTDIRMDRIVVVGLVLLYPTGSLAQERELPAVVREVRWRGDLSEARRLSEEALSSGSVDRRTEVSLRLELARILDRTGLHWNTRPVSEAIAQVDSAAAVTDGTDARLDAEIELMRAELEYRAGMASRDFRKATAHAHTAIELYQALGDRHGEAEGVHRLGLIHLQSGDLETARALFDQSLDLDRSAGERLFFRGEYERHMGLVEMRSGNTRGSIPHFERSLSARRRVGAIDASLFAASILGSALVDVGRADEAQPYLLYAITVADRLNSPMGRARINLVLGRYHRLRGDYEAARMAFEAALVAADVIGSTSIAGQATAAIDELPGVPTPH